MIKFGNFEFTFGIKKPRIVIKNWRLIERKRNIKINKPQNKGLILYLPLH